MRLTRRIGRVGVCICAAAAIPAGAFGQERTGVVFTGGPLGGPPVLNAPFSADATTTVRQTLGDGTSIERSATSRYYRDRAGRVRVEQIIADPENLNATAERQVRTSIYPDPSTWAVYTLDSATRTMTQDSHSSVGAAVGTGDTFALPLGGPRFLVFHGAQAMRELGIPGSDSAEDVSLGSQLIEGMEAIGRRITMTIPAGGFFNDRPIQIVHERWESPELKLVIYSRNSDPRTGVIEYRVTHIRRTEPAADLFVVPADYPIRATTHDDPLIYFAFAERAYGLKGARGGGRP
jgi:hypothetical protein